MNRKVLKVLIITILLLSILVTGCKKKIEEKIVEKILEDTTGNKVDIDKDTATIKTDQGTTQIGDNIKWPEGKMGDIPKLKANISTVIEDKEHLMTMIYFNKLKKEDAEQYVETIKELGFDSVFETTTGDGFMYSGLTEDGREVVFSYTTDGTGTMSYAEKPLVLAPGGEQDTGVSSSPSDNIDMTDSVPWPNDFLDIPELEGKITSISSSGSAEKYIYIEYVKKDDALDYIDKIKEAGFSASPSESISGSFINYESGNENGDYIVFSWSDNENASITMHKSE